MTAPAETWRPAADEETPGQLTPEVDRPQPQDVDAEEAS